MIRSSKTVAMASIGSVILVSACFFRVVFNQRQILSAQANEIALLRSQVAQKQGLRTAAESMQSGESNQAKGGLPSALPRRCSESTAM